VKVKFFLSPFFNRLRTC